MKTDKNIQRAILLAIGLLLFLITGASIVLFDRQAESKNSHSQIYGLWEEQDVPAYITDRFMVDTDGVHVDQRIVDTHYHFDGKVLTYRYQGETYKYIVRDAEVTELERVAPLHYKSIFRLHHR